MEFFHPKRPAFNGRAYYLSPTGKPIAPLPSITIHPIAGEGTPPPADGTMVELGMFLIIGGMSAAWHSLDVAAAQVPSLILEWTQDPEKFLREHLGYTYEPEARVPRATLADAPIRKKQPAVTLKDLGL